MKRCKRNPVNRGRLCKRAARLRRYADRHIVKLRQEIADLDYLIQTYTDAIETGRAVPLDEEFRRRCPRLPKYARPSAERLRDEADARREDLVNELREVRKLRADVSICGDCYGRGKRFPKDRRATHLVQCGRCHGQGTYPRGLGF